MGIGKLGIGDWGAGGGCLRPSGYAYLVAV